MTKVLGVRKVTISILVVTNRSRDGDAGMFRDWGAKIFIYLSYIMHTCVCVCARVLVCVICIMWERCVYWVCWDAKVPCWWFARSIKLTAGACKATCSAPSTYLTPISTLHHVPVLPFYPVVPLHPPHTHTHIHTHTQQRSNKVFDLHNKASSLEEDAWFSAAEPMRWFIL